MARTPDDTSDIGTMIAQAEAELSRLKARRALGVEPVRDPSDPFDPVGCLELWLAALYAVRDRRLDVSDLLSARTTGLN